MSTASRVATPIPTAHPATGAATSLLDAYAPGARFLATPGRTLLARGAALQVPHGAQPVDRRVADTLAQAADAGQQAPVVMGAIPFDHTEPAALSVPGALRIAPPLTSDPLIALPSPGADSPAGRSGRSRSRRSTRRA